MHPQQDKTDKTDKTSKSEVLSPKIQTGRLDITDIQCFEQTPSSNDAGTTPEVPPHELFYLFTARIILEKKVFTR